ncbi:glycosyltransferase family 39 protein [Candidatus Saganbacteria bacterium]|nr:glycosyltransferase family 39 protein [Candidatus Saganbacteria bacterium]
MPGSRKYYLWALILLLAFFLFGYKMWVPSVYEEDEATIAAVAGEMVQDGDLVTMHYNHQPWFHKPPLYIWLAALCLKLFGWSEFAVRLPSLLFGLGTIFLIFHLGKLMFEDESALYAALMGMTSLLLIVLSRTGFVDTPLVFFITLAFYSYFRGWSTLFFISCALAVLSKGLLGIVIPFSVVFPHLLIDKRFKFSLKDMFWFIVNSALLIALATPWWIMEYQIHGAVFIEKMFGKFTWAIYTSTLQAHSGPIYFYLLVILIGFFPWSLFFPFAAWKRKGNSLLWLWFSVVFILFSFAQTKIPGYILPLFPPMVLLTAQAWPRNRAGRWSLGIGVGLILVLILAAVEILVPVGEAYKPAKPLAEKILKEPAFNEIKFYNYKTWLRGGLLFYLKRDIKLISEEAEVIKIMGSDEKSVCFMDPKDFYRIQSQLPKWIKVGSKGFELLYAQNFRGAVSPASRSASPSLPVNPVYRRGPGSRSFVPPAR